MKTKITKWAHARSLLWEVPGSRQDTLFLTSHFLKYSHMTMSSHKGEWEV